MWAVVAASGLHVCEEYAWPGGFLRFMRQAAESYVPLVSADVITARLAVVINALFLLLVVIAAILAPAAPVLVLSVAGLVGLNGLGHVVGSVAFGRYVPGAGTGLVLYLPLSLLAYAAYLTHGVSTASVLLSLAIAVAWNATPLLAMVAMTRWRARRSADVKSRG
jgi:Protein of unknown function with HXXEE motif